MRRLTARTALGDARLRGVAVRLRTALLAVAAAAMVVTAGVWPAGNGSAGAATAPREYLQPQASTTGGTVCLPSGASETCTGTYSGNTAYDPTASSTNFMTGVAPTVTVNQVTDLAHQVVNVSWTHFMPSYNTTGANIANILNPQTFYNGVALMECKGSDVNGQTEPPIYDGAYPATGANNDATNVCYDVFANGATSGPADMEWGYTASGTASTPTDPNKTASCSTAQPGDTVCGTGSIQFQVETKIENSFLGCDENDPCYLVVVPDWGGNDGSFRDTKRPTDSLGRMDYTADCSNHAVDSYTTGRGFGTMVDWNTSCNWQDRFVIPLSFAPTPSDFCSSSNYEFSAEGSPELEQAMQQWEPAWCTAKQNPLDFNYDSGINEYEARSDFLNGGGALTATADMALVTDPASSEATSGSSTQFTYAPIANTGIGIAYYLDNALTGLPITNLKLDARLIAKLLTDSYGYSFNRVCQNSATDPECAQECQVGQTTQTQLCDPAVMGNPTDIFHDPEFYQLNPEYTPANFYDPTGTGDDTEPLVIAGDSDMTYELTRWIESDPDAAAFLAGEKDPWGMHVNTYYKQGETYPVSAFEELDPGFSQNGQAAVDGPAPNFVATMQATWNPITGLDNVDQYMLGWQSSGLSFTAVCANATNQCGPGQQGNVYSQQKNQQESLGARTLFAVVDLGDAGAYQYPLAQLVNPAGNAVGPTPTSMTAALDSMQTNPDKITQYQDFSPKDTAPNAYPLTEVQYAMVPTCGEPASKAQAIAQFLSDVSTSQLYGTTLGELPPYGGYLALSQTQEAQDIAAAQAVVSQDCTSPPPDNTVNGQNPGNNATTGNPGSDFGTTPSTGATPATIPGYSPPPGSSPSPSKSAGPTQPVALGTKGADDSSLAKIGLPVALILGGLFALGGPLAYVAGTAGTGTSFLARRKLWPPLRRVTPKAASPGGGGGSGGSGGSGADPSGAGEPGSGDSGSASNGDLDG